MKKIAFVINRTIKSYGKIVSNIERTFKAFEVKIFNSEYAGHLPVLTETAVNRGYKIIIAVGGDGTLNECVNGVAQAFKKGLSDSPESFDWEGFASISIGLLPTGTGNDFSKSTGVSAKTEQLLALIQREQTQKLDIGWVSFMSKKEEPTYRFFCNITDVGMGGVVVQAMQNKLPLFTNNMMYSWSIMKTFVTYEKSGIRCFNDDFRWEGKVMNLVVANGKYFGSGLGVAPEASLVDGQFEIVILGDISLMDYLRYLGDVKACKKLDHPEVHYHRFDKISIEAADGQPLAIDMDGDFVGFAPMTLVNLQQRLNFFM
jgi:diacylglycerol kinase (ATP)